LAIKVDAMHHHITGQAPIPIIIAYP